MLSPRRYYRSRGQKYSSETFVFNGSLEGDHNAGENFPVINEHTGIVVVSPTNILGNRKVKNFTIKCICKNNDAPIIGALLYVPEGTEPSSVQAAGAGISLYEPNQNVISTFIIPPTCERNTEGVLTTTFGNIPQVVTTSRLARNLSSGDRIVLVFALVNGSKATDGHSIALSGTVNFAIKY